MLLCTTRSIVTWQLGHVIVFHIHTWPADSVQVALASN